MIANTLRMVLRMGSFFIGYPQQLK